MIKKCVVVIVSLVSLPLYGQCELKVQRDIVQADPQALYFNIIQKHFQVLREPVATTMFKYRLQEFTDYIQCIYDTLKTKSLANQKKELEIFSMLADAAQYINENAQADSLFDVIDRLAYKATELYEIYWRRVYKIDEDNQSIPRAWLQSIPAKASLILPDYEQFLTNYESTKNHYEKYNKGAVFPSERLFKFLENQSFMFKSPIKNIKSKFAQFADVLEQLIYRLQEDKKKSWFSKGTIQHHIDLAQEILAGIFNIYPGIITAKVDQKVKMSQNKIDLVIVAESVSLYNIILYIKKSLE